MTSASSVSRSVSMMLPFFVVIAHLLEFVHSTRTNLDPTPEGCAIFTPGEALPGVSEFESGTTRGLGFLEDKNNLKVWPVLAGSLIMITFSISSFILLMGWRYWKSAYHHDMKQQEEVLEFKAASDSASFQSQSTSTPVDEPGSWKVSVPFLPSSTTCAICESDAFVSSPMLSTKESLDHFPFKLTISIHTGFTTGVGPRR